MQAIAKLVSSIVSNSINPELPKNLHQFIGNQRGKMAPGLKIPVDTEMNVTQRDLHARDIFKWIEKHQGVDWNLFGYATAVRFPDGTLELINGQHRITLVKWMLPDVKEVPAHIIDITDQDYAAKLFSAMNGGSARKLNTEELFWAEVIGKDPYALYVRDQLVKMNLACGKVNEGVGRKQVKYPNFVKCLKMGEDATAKAVELIDSAYPGQGIDDQVLSGVTRLLSLTDYADLGDCDTNIGIQFEQWFTKNLADSHQLSELRFNEYKNTSQWYNGVAYGLAKKFSHYQKRKNRAGINLKVVKAIYEAGINKTESSDNDE
jgi:hypothetical protein